MRHSKVPYPIPKVSLHLRFPATFLRVVRSKSRTDEKHPLIIYLRAFGPQNETPPLDTWLIVCNFDSI